VDRKNGTRRHRHHGHRAAGAGPFSSFTKRGTTPSGSGPQAIGSVPVRSLNPDPFALDCRCARRQALTADGANTTCDKTVSGWERDRASLDFRNLTVRSRTRTWLWHIESGPSLGRFRRPSTVLCVRWGGGKGWAERLAAVHWSRGLILLLKPACGSVGRPRGQPSDGVRLRRCVLRNQPPLGGDAHVDRAAPTG